MRPTIPCACIAAAAVAGCAGLGARPDAAPSGDAAEPPAPRSYNLELTGHGFDAAADRILYVAIVRNADDAILARLGRTVDANGDVRFFFWGLVVEGEQYRLDYFVDHHDDQDGTAFDEVYCDAASGVDPAYRALLPIASGDAPTLTHSLTPQPDRDVAACASFPIPGDVDRTGCVDQIDLDLVRESADFSTGHAPPNQGMFGDVDIDGDADFSDFTRLLSNYGRGCP